MKSYLVGGAVRDELLGRVVHDLDYVVIGSTMEQMLALGFIQVGADFPVFLHPKTKHEYALARTERKSGKGYKGFKVDFNASVTLSEDLARRDLTINAIAKDAHGQYVDPYGGRQDLALRVLRHVSVAFSEDPLRVLRVARFAAQLHGLGFTVHPETQQLMAQLAASGELDHLTPERVFAETEKALLSDHPQAYFVVLQQCGALAILFPELHRLVSATADDKNNDLGDGFSQTLTVLGHCATLSPLAHIRWAALLHQLDRHSPVTTEKQATESTDAAMAKQLNERLKVSNRYALLAEKVASYHHLIPSIAAMTAVDILALLERLDSFRRPEIVSELVLVCQAVAQGQAEEPLLEYPPGSLLLGILADCTAVVAKPFVDQGFKGIAIKEQMRQQRLQAIEKFL